MAERLEPVPKHGVGLRCTICNHPARPQIDLATATGLSKRAVARRFGVSRDALWRHAQAHLTAEMRAALTTKLLQREGDTRRILLEEGAGVTEALAWLAARRSVSRLARALLSARPYRSARGNRLSRSRTSAEPADRATLTPPCEHRRRAATTAIVSRVSLRSEPARGRRVRQHAAPAEPIASAALAAVAVAAADLHSPPQLSRASQAAKPAR